MLEVNNLYYGDCMEVMKNIKDKSINCIITDPPYNIARDNNFTTMGRKGIDFGDWDKNADILSWISEIPRILSKDGSVIIFNDWKNLGDIAKELEKHDLIVKDMMRWEKSNPMPRNRDRRYITDFECMIWATNKNAKWVFNRQSDTYDRPKFLFPLTSSSEKVGHTTQKPLALMKEIIIRHTNANDVILDPFIGSGTTAISCIDTNRKYLGIENDENYYNMANERIRKHYESRN